MLKPNTETELAETIAGATKPLVIQGGGTRSAVDSGRRISVSGLSGITLYEPGALTLVARAGTPVAEIETTLAAKNQMLAFEPMDHRRLLGTVGEPTIGGVVAANVSGPRRVQVGACRDFLLGVQFVDGEGNVIKNGGRVMKNVTGYDLARLMCGARGTLGVLTEVSFKVLPKPEVSSTLVFAGLGWTATAAAFSAALSSPYEVSGAARLPKGAFFDDWGAVLLRLDGFRDSVDYRVGELTKRLDSIVGAPAKVVSEPEKNAKLWQIVRDVHSFADTGADIWRISLKPSEFSKLSAIGSHEDTLLDWGGGLAWANVAPGTDVRTALRDVKGHATLVRGANTTGVPRFQPESAPLAKLAEGLRNKFDPKGILNPGLMA